MLICDLVFSVEHEEKVKNTAYLAIEVKRDRFVQSIEKVKLRNTLVLDIQHEKNYHKSQNRRKGLFSYAYWEKNTALRTIKCETLIILEAESL